MTVSTEPPAAAPPGADVAALARRAAANPLVRAVLAAAGGPVLVLDGERRLLAGNGALEALLEPPDLAAHLGDSPCGALGCLHAREAPGGCGAAPACAGCALWISLAAGGDPPAGATGAFNLRRLGRLVAVDFGVRASRLDLGTHGLVVLALQDPGPRRRRAQLEALLGEDLPDALGGLSGWAERLAEGADPRRAARRILDLAKGLGREVEALGLLRRAEDGALAVHPEPVALRGLLEDLRDAFLDREGAAGPRLVVELPGPGPEPVCDRGLLLRVLEDLVARALALAPPAGEVRVRAQAEGDRVRLTVADPAPLPEREAARVLHREPGPRNRGLGGFGALLLVEEFLGGRLAYRAEGGTGRFTLDLPAGAPARAD